MTASWHETEYNAGVRALYEWYGFDFSNSNGAVRARKRVDEPVELPDWIALA